MLTFFENTINYICFNKGEDIANAMTLVNETKKQMQKLKDEWRHSHLERFTSLGNRY